LATACLCAPRSVSNYLLALTPIKRAPFFAGTAIGMFWWSFFYANLGAASSKLFLEGEPVDSLLAELAEQAAGDLPYIIAVALGGIALYVVSERSSGVVEDAEEAEEAS